LLLGIFIPSGGAVIFFTEAAALEELDKMVQAIAPLPPVALFSFIFIKNISVVVISLVLSPLLCLVPLFTLLMNGGLIGLLSRVVVGETSFSFLLSGLLPHGILELPALIIGEAATRSFGAIIIQAIFNKEKRDNVLPVFRHSLKYLIISAILFLVAAAIETWGTPLLLERVA
jgi:stage II sporulation protein M